MRQAALVLVKETQVERTVQAIARDAFTSTDFVLAFSALYPEDWSYLVAHYGDKGDGRGRSYTAATYLGNRLRQIAQKPGSPLASMVRWARGTPAQRTTDAAQAAESLVCT